MPAVDDVNDETRDLAMRFLRVFEYMGKLFAKHRQPNQSDNIIRQLHLSQMHMLGLLHHEPGISQKELAERMQLTPAAVSTSVREMVGYELVDRVPDPDDARLMRLHLSQRGRALFDESQRIRCAGMADLLSALPLDEQRMLVEALERALDAKMDKVRTESHP